MGQPELKKLRDILYDIKVNGNIHAVGDLVNNQQVKGIIKNVCARNKCKGKVAESLLKDYTLRYYKFDEIYIEERYLNVIKKYLGRKTREIMTEDYNNRCK